MLEHSAWRDYSYENYESTFSQQPYELQNSFCDFVIIQLYVNRVIS